MGWVSGGEKGENGTGWGWLSLRWPLDSEEGVPGGVSPSEHAWRVVGMWLSLEGKCVSGGEKRESVGMWVAPICPGKVEGEMGISRSWLSVWWPVDPEEMVPIWITLE